MLLEQIQGKLCVIRTAARKGECYYVKQIHRKRGQERCPSIDRTDTRKAAEQTQGKRDVLLE